MIETMIWLMVIANITRMVWSVHENIERLFRVIIKMTIILEIQSSKNKCHLTICQKRLCHDDCTIDEHHIQV